MSISWVKRFGYEMASKPSAPGVYRLRKGGFFVRAPHGQRALHDATLPVAVATRDSLTKPQMPLDVSSLMPLFGVFAVDLLDEKILNGEITSASTIERYRDTLKHYLLPRFGTLRVDEIAHPHLLDFKKDLAGWIKNGKPSLKRSDQTVNCEPSTANGWLRILRTWLNVMADRYELKNPWRKLQFFTEKNKYSETNPNSLTPKQLRQWLSLARSMFPQHYVFMVLGFVTGRRPGEVRCLRREDISWKTKQVFIRRSHSRKQIVADETKQKDPVTLNLPTWFMDILKKHVAKLPKSCQLLFPSTKGKIRSRSGLDKPFAAIAKRMKLSFKLTPRAMRRSYNDLAREAGTDDLVQRSISGHKTEEMKDLYSTVRAEEQRRAIEKMGKLALN